MGWISWLCPGMNLKRWLLLFTVGVLCCALGLALFFGWHYFLIISSWAMLKN